MTVITEIGKVTKGSFGGGLAECPAGYQAVGGGVNVSNVLDGWISESAPSYNGQNSLTLGPGQHGAASGWRGVVTAIATSDVPAGTQILAVCAPIG